MPIIGVQELRDRAAEVLRQVRETHAEYIITYQGKPVALLLPVQTERQPPVGGWETYIRLAEQVRRDWPAEQDTQNLLDNIRR